MEILPTRDGYGKGLLKQGKLNKNIVVLNADLTDSTRSEWFVKEFPERSFSIGIAEQDMICTAAGLASSGKIPFANTFAIFSERAFEQIRNNVARPNLNVKIIGSHGGIFTGEDGSSAQSIEDFAIYRALPNMAVLCPSDAIEAENLVEEMVKHKGPCYMRLTRVGIPLIFEEKQKFEIGKGIVLKEGKDIAIIACGPLVNEALKAYEELKKENINVKVISMSTIKPLDKALIIKSAKETKAIVTAEDHNVLGGLGSAVAEVVAENFPVPMEFIGVKDVFGESGKPYELYEKYGLSFPYIIKAVKKVLKRKSAQST